MVIKADASKLKGLNWSQFGIRFVLGGLITAIAGILAEKFGPAIGGLFLAFPAILPASVTLVEKNEQNAKREKGLKGDERGRAAAMLDAYGAALGSLALLPFAALVWLLVTRYPAWLVLPGATAVWIASAVAAWTIARRWRHRHAASGASNQKSSAHLTRIDRL